MNSGWEYYNHALVPTTPPHADPDTSWMKERRKWKELAGGAGYPLFARWTTDFDCQEETQWWYCIKDTKLDLSALNSKKRRMVNIGLRSVDVCIIDPAEYAEQLAEVNIAARLGYGEHIELNREKKALIDQFRANPDLDTCERVEYTAAFLKDGGRMVGYGIYEIHKDWILQSVLKTDPQYHKFHASAALAYFCAERYLGEDFNIKYISIGARNISHPTNYYEYLMTYFGYRKAYCRLHVCYNGIIKFIVMTLYPFRRFIHRMAKLKWMKDVSSVLYMEEIRRTFL